MCYPTELVDRERSEDDSEGLVRVSSSARDGCRESEELIVDDREIREGRRAW